MEQQLLKQIAQDIHFLKEKVIDIDNELADLASDLHEVRPEYIEKIKAIAQQKGKVFQKKEDFLHFLQHELWDQTRSAKDTVIPEEKR